VAHVVLTVMVILVMSGSNVLASVLVLQLASRAMPSRAGMRRRS
jgi:hypothetical protein